MTATERAMRRIRATLTTARTRHGLSRRQLARKCGCHRTTLDGLEDGSRTPDIDTVTRYAEVLGLELALVPRLLSNLVELDLDDLVAIVRAARTAAEGHRLPPLTARRTGEALARLNAAQKKEIPWPTSTP